MTMTRREALSAIPAAIAGATAKKERDWWKPAHKKTKHTLPCEERMIRRLNDAYLALQAVVVSHGDCDCDECTDAFHLSWHLDADLGLLEGELVPPLFLKQTPPPRLGRSEAHRRLLAALAAAMESIDDMHVVHGLECPCRFCESAQHCQWLLANLQSQFACMAP
jgi:hypothetical protein